MTQLMRVQGRHTVIRTIDGETEVIYHQTSVVKFNRDRIVLDTGGYESFTTKTRMNQAANQYSLGYSVFQKDFDWFIDFKGKVTPFPRRRAYLDRLTGEVDDADAPHHIPKFYDCED